MNTLRWCVIALLMGTVAVSACGKKGDPIRPGTEKKTEKPAS